jgi:cobalt-zinc-cadmium efflux system outer membrane protein
MEIRLCLLVLLFTAFYRCAAEPQPDTLRLTVNQGEEIFLRDNLPLLAARYNADASKALIQQAKLWDNPVISTDQNIYDRTGFFKHNRVAGQVYVQVMQLIKTAGKRNKAILLAEDNTDISHAQFEDLLRTLRYSLVSDFIEINHQLDIKQLYDTEISKLKVLVSGMDEELKTGNISVKDDIRVKALLFSLQNEVINVEAQLIPLESEVKLLLNNQDTSFILPEMQYKLPQLLTISVPGESQLLAVADTSRPDIKMMKYEMNYASHNLSYQKALAKPDINIGTEYDQHSSYAPDYVGLAISFPLDIFNRNQGNISSAKFNVKQQQVLYDAQTSKVENDLASALAKVKFFQQVNNARQLDFEKNYENLFQNMLKSYESRQVSLLEFIDFADAYKETRLKILEQQTSLVKAIAELNYQAGKDLINLN